ncbi:MAG: hypothetical protein ACK4R6_01560 [Spirosomataceae bacterium]
MRIIYFSGGSRSSTYQFIQNHYPEAQVISYDSSNPLAAFAQIKLQLFDAFPENTLLVGKGF